MLYDYGTPLVFLRSQNFHLYRLYLKYRGVLNVTAFVEPYNSSIDENSLWNGVKVYPFKYYFEKCHVKQKIIVFERDIGKLKNLIDFFNKKGMSFYDDYMWWEMVDKPFYLDIRSIKNFEVEVNTPIIKKLAGKRKICFVNGDAQTGELKKYLIANRVFRTKYMLLDCRDLINVSIDKETLREIIRVSDLIITQSIQKTNELDRVLAVDYLKNNKRKETRLVAICSLDYKGYFPQYKSSSRHISIMDRPLVKYGDFNIDRLQHEGYSAREIAEILSDDNTYSDGYLTQWFENAIADFAKKEEYCDVKMHDYISTNYNKDIMYHYFNHPKSYVIRELAKRILRYIGILDTAIDDEAMLETKSNMFYQEQPVYPCVYKHLKIPYNHPYITPNYLASEYRFDFYGYVEWYFNTNAQYMPDFNARKNKLKVSIWGSCVSREIFNYTDEIDVCAYMLQNPIHTMFSEPIYIDEKDIKASSPFTKRMFKLETLKRARQYFLERPSEWLVLDTCDCRNDFWQPKDNPHVRICDSVTASATFKQLMYKDKFIRVSVFDITEEEWKKYVDDFCKFILKYYKEEHIVLNEFKFAKFYWKDGRIQKYNNNEYYLKLNSVTENVESMLKDRMPRMKVIPPELDPIGDYYSHIGCAPMHYLDEIYIRRCEKFINVI